MVISRSAIVILFACQAAHVLGQVTVENVTYQDGAATLSGLIAYPTASRRRSSGKLPLVLHVHTWSGLSDFEKQRAVRTAADLGYVGFAVSIFTDEENAALASGDMQTKIATVGAYSASPQLFVSRLTAALNLAKAHDRVNGEKIAAAGYCFGGTAVLQFAKLGGASAQGVAGVISFHGGLSGLSGGESNFGNTKVLIANGAADTQIPTTDIESFMQDMTTAGIRWEFSNYATAGHGFTHPSDGTDHFHFDKTAESRSWTSMHNFLSTSLSFDDVSSGGSEIVTTTENVTYTDGDVSLTGFLAYPNALPLEAYPLVIHVHTWGGLTDFEKNRAERTAKELGYVGFAVSVYTDAENAAAAGSDMQAKMTASNKYSSSPDLIVSRLTAAVNFAKTHARVDGSQVAAVGYCFGGAAVLSFAKLGGAAGAGVAAVASFHGGLTSVLPPPQSYCPTRVAVYNGAADTMIPFSDVGKLEAILEESQSVWESTTYAMAGHGFTHPVDGSDHFQFDEAAERRSWVSTRSFLGSAWQAHNMGTLNLTSCVTTGMAGSGGNAGAAAGTCADDNAAVAAAGANYGVTECSANLCEGQWAATMGPMCKETCGLCCADDNAAVAAAGANYGVTECSANLCEGQWAATMGPMCKQTCGLCSSTGDANASGSPTSAPTSTPTATPAAAKVVGMMSMTVSDSVAFVADPNSKPAVEASIAEHAGASIHASQVNATLQVARRLKVVDLARRLQSVGVQVDYEITVADEAAGTALVATLVNVAAEDMTQTISSKLVTDYGLNVTTVAMPSVVNIGTTPGPDEGGGGAGGGSEASVSVPRAVLARTVIALALVATAAWAS